MTLINLDKAPFPWFGGKSKAAPLVWQLLGDVGHYVEPFYGSGAVLLNRPHPANRPYVSEPVNDIDGFVCNFWRAVQFAPEATAAAASWPVTEADKQARQVALLRWRDDELDRLAGDAMFYDAVMAGWWAWAVSVHIGTFDGLGPWTADPRSGRIYAQPRGTTRQPGVRRDRPHLTDNGQGVNHAGSRMPGVRRALPHLSSDGRGVNRPGSRQPGVLDQPPTDPDMLHRLDADWGGAHHNLVMPELIRWFRYLSARLRHVRILNGDWTRLVTTGAAHTLSVRSGDGPCGVFLDPPYADTADRTDRVYMADSAVVAHDVRDWCLAHGDHPRWRIVLAGYDGEHGDTLTDAGWTSHEWFTAGHLTGGMGNISRNGGHQQQRERLYASPHCHTADTSTQGQLWADTA